MPKHRDYHLTCRRDFGTYKRGEHIDDAAEVERILGSELRPHVIKVAAEPPKSAAAPSMPMFGKSRVRA